MSLTSVKAGVFLASAVMEGRVESSQAGVSAVSVLQEAMSVHTALSLPGPFHQSLSPCSVALDRDSTFPSH